MRTPSAVTTTQSCVQIYLWIRDTSLYRTANWVPMVSTIQRFHCNYVQCFNQNGIHVYVCTYTWTMCYGFSPHTWQRWCCHLQCYTRQLVLELPTDNAWATLAYCKDEQHILKDTVTVCTYVQQLYYGDVLEAIDPTEIGLSLIIALYWANGLVLVHYIIN